MADTYRYESYKNGFPILCASDYCAAATAAAVQPPNRRHRCRRLVHLCVFSRFSASKASSMSTILMYCGAESTWYKSCCYCQPATSEFMGKTFQAAQLTHERYLTIDHTWKILFWYLPNWTSTNLWSVVLYVTYSTTHQRLVEVQFGRYQKNILLEWSMVKNLSCVSCAAWNVFPINSLMPNSSVFIYFSF